MKGALHLFHLQINESRVFLKTTEFLTCSYLQSDSLPQDENHGYCYFLNTKTVGCQKKKSQKSHNKTPKNNFWMIKTLKKFPSIDFTDQGQVN